MAKITDPQIATLIKGSKRIRANLLKGSAQERKRKAISHLQQLGLLTKQGRLAAAYR